MRKDTKLLCIQNTDCFSCHLNKDGRGEEKGKGCFQGKSRGESVDAKRKESWDFFLPVRPRNNAKVRDNVLV